MAIVRVPDEQRAILEFKPARNYLASLGIEYERWRTDVVLDAEASQEEVLDAYSSDIERLKKTGGYTTADVIDITSDTPGLEAMRIKFNTQHSHDEDEVRFILAGRGLSTSIRRTVLSL